MMKTIFKKIIIFCFGLFLVIAFAGCSLSQTTTVASTGTTTSFTTAPTTEATTSTTTALTTIMSTETSVPTTATTNATTALTTLPITTTSSVETTTTNKYLGIDVSEITKTEYPLGTSFDYTSITVLLIKANGTTLPLGSSIYTISGFDSTSPGEKTITVSYSEFSTTFLITVLESNTGLDITMAYYEAAQGLIGEPLMLALRTIINTGYAGHVYTDASYALDDSDEDPDNPANVILVYSGSSVSGIWDAGNTWNKEHVWPQSLLGETAGGTVNMASDLQNLKPCTPSINSSRGNKYYANETTIASFAPRDAVKGDLARILFYMVTMYPVLELVDGTPYVHQMALLSVLLEWNDLDPVDDFERNRNEFIYTYQNNRNPFIDYPEFVDLIWDNLG